MNGSIGGEGCDAFIRERDMPGQSVPLGTCFSLFCKFKQPKWHQPHTRGKYHYSQRNLAVCRSTKILRKKLQEERPQNIPGRTENVQQPWNVYWLVGKERGKKNGGWDGWMEYLNRYLKRNILKDGWPEPWTRVQVLLVNTSREGCVIAASSRSQFLVHSFLLLFLIYFLLLFFLQAEHHFVCIPRWFGVQNRTPDLG